MLKRLCAFKVPAGTTKAALIDAITDERSDTVVDLPPQTELRAHDLPHCAGERRRESPKSPARAQVRVFAREVHEQLEPGTVDRLAHVRAAM
jgi:hypothetical protein